MEAVASRNASGKFIGGSRTKETGIPFRGGSLPVSSMCHSDNYSVTVRERERSRQKENDI